MTSFIILSRDKEKRTAYIKKYSAEHKISEFDITSIEKDTTKQTQSIGIDEIKKLQKHISLKPFQSSEKILVVEDAHLLTPEAQNALLKTLEEPPEHTFIFLTAETKEAFLPTILSRCQIITLSEEAIDITTRERNAITEFITQLPEMGIAAKLKKAESLTKEKEKALDWAAKTIIIMREQLLSDEKQINLVEPIKKFQTLHTTLKTTNINPRFAVEQTLLAIH